MREMDASGVSMEVVESGESTTQEENAGIMDKVRGILEKHGYDTEGMTEEQAIGIFNELLEEQGKPYWLCPDCGKWHPKNWTHCDLPCVQYEHSRDLTEQEWEELNGLFDPSNYKDDDTYLRYPHTRLTNWLMQAERVYQVKKGLKTFDIHNGPNAVGREHRMTDEERECWIAEIRAFMQAKQYRHIAWRNTTPAYIKEYHPGNCTLKPVIRTKTLKNGENEKIVEITEYVRA